MSGWAIPAALLFAAVLLFMPAAWFRSNRLKLWLVRGVGLLALAGAILAMVEDRAALR